MRFLSDEVYGHDNHFNLIRLVAASLVLFSHSFALSTGQPLAEPMRADFGMTLGALAVDIFFVTSGLLVTASLERRASITGFATARFFRIWPGLAVAVLVTALLIGPVVTTLPWTDYLRHADTRKYILHNVLVVGSSWQWLAGVFKTTPWPGVNGSLWTLPFEVRCYAALLLLWVVTPRWLFQAAILAVACVFTALHADALSKAAIETSPWRLYCMFSVGAALFVLRRWLPLGWGTGATCLAVLLAGVLHRPWYAATYTVCLPVLVIWSAYLPGGALKQFNTFGDLSYGTYVYAWPVQQVLVTAAPGIGPLALFATSWPITLAIAAASWRLVEAPAIARGRRVAATLEPNRVKGSASTTAVA